MCQFWWYTSYQLKNTTNMCMKGCLNLPTMQSWQNGIASEKRTQPSMISRKKFQSNVKNFIWTYDVERCPRHSWFGAFKNIGARGSKEGAMSNRQASNHWRLPTMYESRERKVARDSCKSVISICPNVTHTMVWQTCGDGSSLLRSGPYYTVIVIKEGTRLRELTPHW